MIERELGQIGGELCFDIGQFKVGNDFEVQVPLFVNTGDKIEIDTRTGEYRRRV